jgi:hypothetical protein
MANALRTAWSKAVAFYKLCAEIARAWGAIKVMGIIFGGVLLVLAALLAVSVVAFEAVGAWRFGLLLFAFVASVVGGTALVVGLRARGEGTPAPAVAADDDFLDLCPPGATPKRALGVVQEGDQPPRIGYTTFGRDFQRVKIASALKPRRLYVFEPLECAISADDLPVTLRHPEYNNRPILTVHRFKEGGIVLQEQSRCVTVRFWMYFGDQDWEPPSQSQGAVNTRASAEVGHEWGGPVTPNRRHEPGRVGPS